MKENMKRLVMVIAGLLAAGVCFAQTAETFPQEGLASWYGTEFDGQTTASGEPFDSTKFTAAHPSLPFGTLLIITNKYNNKQVVVRVNDRGPFISTRIIDLSKAAAEQLDMIVAGTAPVIVDAAATDAIVGPVSGIASPSVAQAQPAGTAVSPSAPAAPSAVPPAANAGASAAQPTSGPLAADAQAANGSPASAPAAQTAQAASAAVPSGAAPASPQPVQPTSGQPVAAQGAGVQAASPAGASPATTGGQTGTSAAQALPAGSGLRADMKPGIPPGGTNKRYRVQVGSYKVPRNAVEAFDKLKNVGLSPSYERSGDLYRVVLSGIKADDVPVVAEKIRLAGFTEGLVREEP